MPDAPLLDTAFELHLADTKCHLRFFFDCPLGARGLRIVLTFDPPSAGEARSLLNFSLSGPDGFRGSCHRHGRRHEVLLGDAFATPGFLPGFPEAGRWEVIVHTHAVMDATRATLRAELADVPGWAPHTEPGAPPPFAAPGWMAGDLHCHTDHSDARWTAGELARAATARGLSFLALTDHNTLSGREELRAAAPHLLQLPGTELTTFYGHATVLGELDPARWTRLEPQKGTLELAREVAASGGVFTIAHPFAAGDPLCTGCAWTYFDLRPENATHLEVWNGPWTGRHNQEALAYWYKLLEEGRRTLATAGTDAHGPAYQDGCGFTCTPSTQDPSELLAQLRAGNTQLGGAALDLAVTVAGEKAALGSLQAPGVWDVSLRWSGLPEGCQLVQIVDGVREERAIPSEGGLVCRHDVRCWLNFELRRSSGDLYLLTNPVFARRG